MIDKSAKYAATYCAIIAAVLLFFINLSAPSIHGFGFLGVESGVSQDLPTGNMTFGNYGACYNLQGCHKYALTGHSVGFGGAANVFSGHDSLLKGATIILPIVTILAIFAGIGQAILPDSTAGPTIAVAVVAVLALIDFILHVVLWKKVRQTLIDSYKKQYHVDTSFGPALWLLLVSMIILWCAAVAAWFNLRLLSHERIATHEKARIDHSARTTGVVADEYV